MITGVIHWTAGVETVIFLGVLVLAKKCNKMGRTEERVHFGKGIISALETLNAVYVTIVSLFPLLGMLGTVMALLNLDMVGEMDGLRNNFFQALDTTKLGIIYAAIYKLVYAFRQSYIEEQIVNGKELRKKETD